MVESFHNDVLLSTKHFAEELSGLYRAPNTNKPTINIVSINNGLVYLHEYAKIYAGNHYLLNSGLSILNESTESRIHELLQRPDEEIIKLYAKTIALYLSPGKLTTDGPILITVDEQPSHIISCLGPALTNVLYMICGFDLAIILKSKNGLENQFISLKILSADEDGDNEFTESSELDGIVELTFKEPSYADAIKEILFTRK